MVSKNCAKATHCKAFLERRRLTEVLRSREESLDSNLIPMLGHQLHLLHYGQILLVDIHDAQLVPVDVSTDGELQCLILELDVLSKDLQDAEGGEVDDVDVRARAVDNDILVKSVEGEGSG